MNATAAQQHEVLVLGAGYAGLSAAIQLAARTRKRGDLRVTLVNPYDTFTERLRLHMTATGQETAEMNIPELLDGTGAGFVRGWVTAVDPEAKTVRIDDDRVLRYDTLVYGLGSVADTVAVPGVDDHAYTLNSPEDAATLADRLTQLDGGTVVVGGSGLTGVEAAAEIAERHPELQVVLLGRAEPGTSMHPKAKAHLDAALARLGVRVRSGVEVVKVLPDSVKLADGSSIPAAAVLWTCGTRVSPLAAAAGLTVDGRGRVVTDRALRSVSHPDVYAVGDAAAIRQGYSVLHLDQRRTGRGPPRAGTRDRHADLRLRPGRPHLDHPQRGQPRQASRRHRRHSARTLLSRPIDIDARRHPRDGPGPLPQHGPAPGRSGCGRPAWGHQTEHRVRLRAQIALRAARGRSHTRTAVEVRVHMDIRGRSRGALGCRSY
ncbi:NAD(P)/FAD-dependent oxidoreductase [Streptomyces sp. NPDC058220]|uniref:NAD(P)/FAD-dependent oxidoreductase n=1 Tax=Streptomyces sp. NPDC058220 TaxID=3346387 RepID=UPI0036E315A1